MDGLIAICAGAGGHAGLLSPFAFMSQLHSLDFKGNIVLGGSITDGRGIRAAQALGADYAYMGTRFIATKESMASQDYKVGLVLNNRKCVFLLNLDQLLLFFRLSTLVKFLELELTS